MVWLWGNPHLTNITNMSAAEFREIAIKARNERRAKLESTFQTLLTECRNEAGKELYFKDFNGTLDPLVVKMFEERGFRVNKVNPERVFCPRCRHLPGEEGCVQCRDGFRTKVLWGSGLDGDKPADE